MLMESIADGSHLRARESLAHSFMDLWIYRLTHLGETLFCAALAARVHRIDDAASNAESCLG
jgi:hypothetical protein